MADVEWRRIAGFRVVVSWPQNGIALPPAAPVAGGFRARLAGLAGVLLLLTGTVMVGAVLGIQQHAPQPATAAAGALAGQSDGHVLARSLPVSLAIPAIGVHAAVLRLGTNPDGTMQVPSLGTQSGAVAWYKYSPTPGQTGASVIEGHVDSYQGPAVFFRLGALRPGNRVDVRLADGVTAVFRVTGVRRYLKSRFPAKAIYAGPGYAALRLITCGGLFDYRTGHYLSSTVVFASLTSARPSGSARDIR